MGALVLWAEPADAQALAPDLGTAESFAVLAGAGITNTGPTTVGGDIGTHPTPSITGENEITFTGDGTNHGANTTTQGAKDDLQIAYDSLAGQGPPSTISADLGGQTLVSGVYKSGSSIGLTGTVTLDAQGDPNAVFVFQAGSTLTTASNSTVALINGAQACNVFWQVGSSATLGTNSTFRGNLLAHTDISANTGAKVDGRLLALGGAVTLDTNTIEKAVCEPTVTTAPTTTAPTTTTPATTTTAATTTLPTTTTTAGTTTAPTTTAPTTTAPTTTTVATTTTPGTTTPSTTTTTPTTTISGGTGSLDSAGLGSLGSSDLGSLGVLVPVIAVGGSIAAGVAASQVGPDWWMLLPPLPAGSSLPGMPPVPGPPPAPAPGPEANNGRG